MRFNTNTRMSADVAVIPQGARYIAWCNNQWASGSSTTLLISWSEKYGYPILLASTWGSREMIVREMGRSPRYEYQEDCPKNWMLL